MCRPRRHHGYAKLTLMPRVMSPSERGQPVRRPAAGWLGPALLKKPAPDGCTARHRHSARAQCDALRDRTVSSVARQTIGTEHIELIVVDDGSTDGTAEQLERLAASHPWMRLFRTTNSGGPAAPRNLGLDRAHGEYVFFLDADDYLGDEALERMIAYARENGSDIVQGRLVGVGGRRVYPLGEHNRPHVDVLTSGVYWLLNPIKLFRRAYLEAQHLRFPEDISYGEDQPFVARALLNAQVVSVLNDYECVYWLLREDESNLTLKRHSLADYRRIVEVMFAIVSESVEPGAGRDNLMRRHFEFGVMHVMRALADESDDQVRAEGLAACSAGWTPSAQTRWSAGCLRCRASPSTCCARAGRKRP